ncbi:MAG: hypothetical protein ABIG44_18575 [Planctomycetota bacterium]
MQNMAQMIYNTLTQHIPHDAAWMAFAGPAVLGLFGLILMVKGAKLAPLMSALAFLGIGVLAGSFTAHWLGSPFWVSVAITAVLGFVLGLVLFKVWLAVLISICFVACSLSLYGGKVITPYLANYSSNNYQAENATVGVTLPDPGATVAVAETPQIELSRIWTYLSTEVPSFLTSFWAILISTGLAGLVFGLLLHRFSRALFAATAGTFFFLTAAVATLQNLWPSGLDWIQSLGIWQWLIIALLWGVSLGYNLLDQRNKSQSVSAEDELPEGETATA